MTTSHEELTRLIRGNPLVMDAELVDGADGALIALIVPQGYVPGPVLRQHAMSSAGESASRVGVVVVRRIPRDHDGLLDRDRALVLAGQPGALHRYEPPGTGAERLLAELVGRLLPDAQVSMSDGLAPLGGDSLIALELIALIEERTGVELDPQELYSAETMRDLAQRLDALRQADRVADG
jgi:acyl carrier protein